MTEYLIIPAATAGILKPWLIEPSRKEPGSIRTAVPVEGKP